MNSSLCRAVLLDVLSPFCGEIVDLDIADVSQDLIVVVCG